MQVLKTCKVGISKHTKLQYNMENIDWKSLPFGYLKTNYNVRFYNRNGKWGEMEITSSEVINLHMAATALHYGQESFEGLKSIYGKGREGEGIQVGRKCQEDAKFC